MTDWGARALAAAIVLQALKDFQRGNMSEYEWRMWCNSEWYHALTEIPSSEMYKKGLSMQFNCRRKRRAVYEGCNRNEYT